MNNLRFKLEDKIIHVEYGEGEIVGLSYSSSTARTSYLIAFKDQSKLIANYLGIYKEYINMVWATEIKNKSVILSDNINYNTRYMWIKEDEDLKAL